MKFKVGDWVVRKNSNHKHLVVGGIYKVDNNAPYAFGLIVDGANNCHEDNFELSKNKIVTNILNDL